MLVWNRFEKEYRRLFTDYHHGSTIWSPLAGGILSGKYNDGNIPAGSRYDKDPSGVWNWYMSPDKKDSTLKKLRALAKVAKDIDYTQAQLALAWAIASKDVSTCILGFSRLS
jgi:aryl-alcohol dehydrogenase-like predicted oxidoreductase